MANHLPWHAGQFEKQGKEKTAVALQYDPTDPAPKILAVGKGHLADQIVSKAQESDVPLYQDSKLAGTLAKLEIGDSIPPDLYEVVAEILLFVDGMDKIKGKLAGAGITTGR